MAVKPKEINENDARKLVAGEFGEVLAKNVVNSSAPLGFRYKDSNGVLHLEAGTVFFVRTPKRTLAVTAKHVFEAYLKLELSSAEIICQIGHLRYDIKGKFISWGQAIDIATFSIESDFIEQLGKHPINSWPPIVPNEGDGLLFCGFPASEIETVAPNSFSFGALTGIGVAKTVTEHQFTTRIEREFMVHNPALGSLPPPQMEIGGTSGGPVLRLVHSGILSWRWAGVIVQGWPTREVIVAHRADCVDQMGFVRG